MRIRSASPAGEEGVYLVEEYQCRSRLAGFAEYLPHRPLRFAHPFAEQLRSLDADEIDIALRSQCSHQEGLSRSGQAIEQYAPGRPNAHGREGFGIFQWPVHGLDQ